MRVGVFITQYPYRDPSPGYFAGGTGHVARLLSDGLARRGHGVTVYTTSKDRRFSREQAGGVSVLRFPKWFELAQTYVSGPLVWRPRRDPMDIVHAHAGNPPATLGAYWASRRSRAPLVVTYHGDFEASYGGLARRASVVAYTKWFRRKMLPAADAIICPSAHFVDDSPVLRPFKDKVTIIPNGIDPAEVPSVDRIQSRKSLSIADDDVVVLFLGSLAPYKGPEVLLGAAIRLAKTNPSIRVLFAGDGPLRGKLEQMATKAGLGNRVAFLGAVNEATKWKAFASADIFCLPSTMRTENFPIAILEAQLFGLPVVTSDLPTFQSLVKDGENGASSISGDPDDLARALRKLVEDRATRERFGANSRAKVARYTGSRVSADTEALFEGLLR